MQVAAAQLSAQLQRGLKPLYTVHGDEALLVQEAADAIRAAARTQGYTERTVFTVAGAHFDWSAVLASGSELSLFADKQLIEIRIPSGKPGKDGSQVLQQLAEQAAGNDTALTLVVLPRLDSATQKSAWFAAKHALPFMREQGHGSIVSISSVASIQAYPLLGYKTMKAALNAMTENMAAAHAKHGIRINAILPGLMNTPMAIENRVAKGQRREDVVADRDSRIPLKGKQGTGWDVAHAALFLHSEEASFITGVTLVVDGGETIAHGH
jgi:NAD(P)-dependent dehydrogenase (short-subunit alcohol dehydrogenase family)